jgi:hypothetical protein
MLSSKAVAKRHTSVWSFAVSLGYPFIVGQAERHVIDGAVCVLHESADAMRRAWVGYNAESETFIWQPITTLALVRVAS